MNQFYNVFPEGNACQFLPAGTEFSKYWKWKGNSSLELEMICSSSVIRIFSSGLPFLRHGRFTVKYTAYFLFRHGKSAVKLP